MKPPKGFTLIELLVVITIIGIFVSLAVPIFKAARGKGEAWESSVTDVFLTERQIKQAQLEELRKANRLKEEELRILKSKLPAERP